MKGEITIFVSSVQKELADCRRAVKTFIENDPLLRRFFRVFLFEDLPARDRRADAVYLAEVDGCAIYVGLFGNDYGFEDTDGARSEVYRQRSESSTVPPLNASPASSSLKVKAISNGIPRCKPLSTRPAVNSSADGSTASPISTPQFMQAWLITSKHVASFKHGHLRKDLVQMRPSMI